MPKFLEYYCHMYKKIPLKTIKMNIFKSLTVRLLDAVKIFVRNFSWN